MANNHSLAALGSVVKADKGFKAKIETWADGEKYKFSGPLRKMSRVSSARMKTFVVYAHHQKEHRVVAKG